MAKRQAVLGERGLHLIRESAQAAQEIERAARRARIEEASVRPVAGTSDLLGRPLRVTESLGTLRNGKVGVVETHDLVAMAPIQLIQARKGAL